MFTYGFDASHQQSGNENPPKILGKCIDGFLYWLDPYRCQYKMCLYVSDGIQTLQDEYKM